MLWVLDVKEHGAIQRHTISRPDSYFGWMGVASPTGNLFFPRMAHHQVSKLSSKIEVIELLQSLLGHEPSWGTSNQLQTEWKIISQRLANALQDQGKENWDFVLMDWPADVPLFNVSINKAALSEAISIDDIAYLLASLELPWCVRIECLDRIQDNLMVGGDEIRDAVVTKDMVYVWEAKATTRMP